MSKKNISKENKKNCSAGRECGGNECGGNECGGNECGGNECGGNECNCSGCASCHGHGDEEENPLPALIISVALGIVAYILTEVIFKDINRFIALGIWAVPYLVSAWDVLKETFEKCIHGNFFNEEFLMAVASIGAMAVGNYPESVAVMVFYRLGELFEDKAVEKSRNSIISLMNIKPDSATVIRDGCEVTVTPENVEIGEIIIIKPGEKIPLDGVIVEGHSCINASALTGESKILDRMAGDSVISGSLNESGLIKVKVSKCYGESTVYKILKLVEESAEKKAKTENFITRFAKIYTPAVVGSAVLVALIPSIITGNWSVWVYRALTFLVVSCPCALVVSVPLTFYGGVGCASKYGILVKGSNYLEMLAKSDTVVFDKTGTLTRGNFSVEDVHPNKITVDELLDITAAAESYSSHPVAESIVAKHKGHIDKSRIGEVKEIAGKGIEAQVDGITYFIGNGALMDSVGASWHECHLVGTIVHVARADEPSCSVYLGHIVINDEIKPDSSIAISELKKLGIRNSFMLTGDEEKVAKNVAKRIGVSEYHAGLLPQDKISYVEGYLDAGKKLIFVGDGINDAPVLMRSNVGIAMGALGSDAAIEAADVVIMDDMPSKIPTAIKIARKTMKIAKENIIFSLSIKLLILLLSAFGITGMWIAVFGDVGVLILAVLNSLRAMR